MRKRESKRVHLRLEYGWEFDRAMENGFRDFCVGGIAYALIIEMVSVNATLHERCTYAVAWKLPALNDMVCGFLVPHK